MSLASSAIITIRKISLGSLIATIILLSALFSGEAAAGRDYTMKLKSYPIKKMTPVRQKITPDSVNYSAADFFEAYTGNGDNDRNKVLLYLLGVLDTTEGKTWCNYDSVKITPLRAVILEYFKKLPQNELAKERASAVIEKALRNSFPSCKGNRSTTLSPIKQKITPDSVDYSAADFFEAYMGNEDNARDKVLFYMLGVLDTTEGKVWCNYWGFKTITLRESVFEYFDKLPKDRLQERASSILEEALGREFPSCRGVK